LHLSAPWDARQAGGVAGELALCASISHAQGVGNFDNTLNLSESIDLFDKNLEKRLWK
jgi:hypothetical protein